MDVKVKNMENKIKEAFLIEKPRMARQYADDHTNELEDYHQELISLLPWLGPHITKCSNSGNALQTIERVAQTVARLIEDFLRTILEGKMDTRTGGVTT